MSWALALLAMGVQDSERLIYSLAMMLQGRSVVRLKGGCPSVFSRCGSELRALAAAGCAAELVPGVSSALAAPLFAGKSVATRLYSVMYIHARSTLQCWLGQANTCMEGSAQWQCHKVRCDMQLIYLPYMQLNPHQS